MVSWNLIYSNAGNHKFYNHNQQPSAKVAVISSGITVQRQEISQVKTTKFYPHAVKELLWNKLLFNKTTLMTEKNKICKSSHCFYKSCRCRCAHDLLLFTHKRCRKIRFAYHHCFCCSHGDLHILRKPFSCFRKGWNDNCGGDSSYTDLPEYH